MNIVIVIASEDFGRTDRTKLLLAWPVLWFIIVGIAEVLVGGLVWFTISVAR
ncbi:hypothetical protein ACTGJ9_039550 [Bradyrhizobium sp. RDM12]